MDEHATMILSADHPVSGRRYELDWLRTLVVLGLIPYHAAVVFATGPGDYVKSPQRNIVFDLFATMLSFFGMPLLFMVAGAATWFALGRRNPRQFLRERIARLGIPFLFGVLALVPVQLYFAHLASPSYHLTYFQFYRDFLIGWANIAQHRIFGLGFQYWGHLWFILYLLAVSVCLLPLLLWLRRPGVRRILSSDVANARSPLPLFLLVGVPLIGIEVALQGPIGLPAYADYTNLYSGPAGLVLYAAAFLVGYLIYSDAHLQQAAVHYRIPALVQGLALLAMHEIALAIAGEDLVNSAWGSFLIRCLRSYITCCLLIAILGYAQRYLHVNGPALRYLNEASYPIYILHMPILTILGFYIVRWQGPLMVIYPLLLSATACFTFAVYEGIVRRFALTRFLFALKTPVAGSEFPIVPAPGAADALSR